MVRICHQPLAVTMINPIFLYHDQHKVGLSTKKYMGYVTDGIQVISSVMIGKEIAEISELTGWGRLPVVQC
jgi:hypothetical protein